MLYDRDEERSQIDQVIEAARTGQGRALVVLGEAGIGKTALLNDAVERTEGVVILRSCGAQSEAHLPYSGLFGLLRPLIPRIGGLARPHAEALNAALGLEGRTRAEPFAVGAATLSLLSESADVRPIVCIADDLQWTDKSSALAMMFAARRLGADAVSMLFALRPGEPLDDRMLPKLALGGISIAAARLLIQAVVGEEVSQPVLAQLVGRTEGNPLALIEITSILGAAERLGRSPLADHLPVGPELRRAFQPRIQRLPGDVLRALVLISVASAETSDVVARAAEMWQLPSSSIVDAVKSGLAMVAGDTLLLRHPLLTTVIMEGTAIDDVRSAHRLLAQALPSGFEIERVWHLASASPGPDDEIAASLDRVAEACANRGDGHAATAACRAAASLSSTTGAKVTRLRAAAEMSMSCGEPAQPLLEECLLLTPDQQQRLDIQVLRLVDAATQGDALLAQRILGRGNSRLPTADPARIANLLSCRIVHAWNALDLLAVESIIDDLVAVVDFDSLTVNPDAAFSKVVLSVALASVRGDVSQLLGVAESIAAVPLLVTPVLIGLQINGLYNEHNRLFDQSIRYARSVGATGALAWILSAGSHGLLLGGEVASARANAAEGADLAVLVGNRFAEAVARSVLTTIAALQGDQATYKDQLVRVDDDPESERPPSAQALVHLARSSAAEADQRYGDAIAELMAVRELGERWPRISVCYHRIHSRLVELFVRLGDIDSARSIADDLQLSTARLQGPWPRIEVARCLALVGPEIERRDRFAAALEAHALDGGGLETARTELLFGTMLRRGGQRREARSHLGAAIRQFERLGTELLMHRAEAELEATGARSKAIPKRRGEQLTTQELSVALQVARGVSNRDAGAALYLSTKTIEMHLGRVFRKLGLASRAELVRMVAVGGSETLIEHGPTSVVPSDVPEHR